MTQDELGSFLLSSGFLGCVALDRFFFENFSCDFIGCLAYVVVFPGRVLDRGSCSGDRHYFHCT